MTNKGRGVAMIYFTQNTEQRRANFHPHLPREEENTHENAKDHLRLLTFDTAKYTVKIESCRDN